MVVQIARPKTPMLANPALIMPKNFPVVAQSKSMASEYFLSQLDRGFNE